MTFNELNCKLNEKPMYLWGVGTGKSERAWLKHTVCAHPLIIGVLTGLLVFPCMLDPVSKC